MYGLAKLNTSYTPFRGRWRRLHPVGWNLHLDSATEELVNRKTRYTASLPRRVVHQKLRRGQVGPLLKSETGKSSA